MSHTSTDWYFGGKTLDHPQFKSTACYNYVKSTKTLFVSKNRCAVAKCTVNVC